MRILPTTLQILTISFTACGFKNPTNSSLLDFQSPNIIDTTPLNTHLERAGNIPHSISLNTVDTGKYFFDSTFLNITFSDLTQNEFNFLKQTYGGWSIVPSLVTYLPHHNWNLVDFLPPVMQAALNFTFLPETRTVKLPRLFASNPTEDRQDTTVTLLSNCWGSAYEILRAAQSKTAANKFSIFYAPQKLAGEVFFSNQWSTEVTPYSKHPFPIPSLRNANLQPGDILLVGREWLQHVAIFIDNDIYFEKAGSGNTALYRLTTWETLAKTWPPELHGHSWRRFNKNNLPLPQDIFNLKTSLPKNISTARFSAHEIQNFTVEINTNDSTGEPIGATWLERRDVPLRYDSRGRALIQN